MPLMGLTGAGQIAASMFPSFAGLADACRTRRASAIGRSLRPHRRLRTAMAFREILGPPRGLNASL